MATRGGRRRSGSRMRRGMGKTHRKMASRVKRAAMGAAAAASQAAAAGKAAAAAASQAAAAGKAAASAMGAV